jgi:hypothetical protein
LAAAKIDREPGPSFFPLVSFGDHAHDAIAGESHGFDRSLRARIANAVETRGRAGRDEYFDPRKRTLPVCSHGN